MSNNRNIIQVTFEKGIIETWKQEALSENGKLASALYMDNWDPNLEHQSLVKRFGYGMYLPSSRPTIVVTEDGDNFVFLKRSALHNFSNNFNNQSANKYNNIFHLELLNTTKPYQNFSQVIFIRRIAQDKDNDILYTDYNRVHSLENPTEATGVVGYTLEYLSPEEPTIIDKDWHEAWTDTQYVLETSEFKIVYPGYYVLGTYADSSRYGEQILFTTTMQYEQSGPDNEPEFMKFDGSWENVRYNPIYKKAGNFDKDFVKLLYPCYKYAYWDITKKRKDSNQFWNGITFIDDLQNKAIYTKWKVQLPSLSLAKLDIKVIDITKPSTDAEPDSTNLPTDPTLYGDMTLVLRDRYLDETNNYYFGAIWHLYLSNLVSWVNSFEYCDSIHFDTVCAELLKYNYYIFYAIYTHIPEFSISDSFIGDDLLSFTKEQNILLKEQQLIKWIKSGLAQCRRNSGDILSGDSFDEDIIDRAVLFKQPNYFDIKLPRPNHYGQTYQFVLTVKIDNIDIVVKQLEFIAKNGPDYAGEDYYEIREKISTHPEINSLGISYWHYPLISPETHLKQSDPFYCTPQTNIEANNSLTTLDSIDNIQTWEFIADSVEALDKQKARNDGFAIRQNINYNPETKDTFKEYILPGTHIVGTGSNGNGFVYQEKYYVLSYGLRINNATFEKLLDVRATEIGLYLCQQSEENEVRSTGIISYTKGCDIYKKPDLQIDVKNPDYAKYRLIHKFLIQGNAPIINDYTQLDKQNPYSITNTWQYLDEDADSFKLGYWAVPGADKSKGQSLNAGEPNIYALYDFLGDSRATDTFERNNHLSPNFYIRDYPIDTPPLTIGGSGKYWKGLGARCITVIKGLPFLGGTINADGDEEVSIVRWSVIQNGTASPDTFYEENQLQFGHKPITALKEYRGQLMVFNREETYRHLLKDVFNPATWEFLQLSKGQGTFSSKTVIATPYGIVYLNEAGVWISDGTKPKSLTDDPDQGLAISNLYCQLAINDSYKFTTQIEPGNVYIEDGYNVMMELHYDEFNDELIINTPVTRGDIVKFVTIAPLAVNQYNFTHQVQLKYNFSKHNWRLESYPLKNFLELTSAKPNNITYSKYGKLAQCIPFFYQLQYTKRIPVLNRIDTKFCLINQYLFDEYVQSTKKLWDEFLHVDGLVDDRTNIITELITHIIGDGIKDDLLRNIVLETNASNPLLRISGADFEYGNNQMLDLIFDGLQSAIADPYFAYDLRTNNWKDQDIQTWFDLIHSNMFDKNSLRIRKTDKAVYNPFTVKLQTPNVNTLNVNSKENKESIILNAPLQTPFRKMRFKLRSIELVKIQKILISIIQFNRKKT